MTVLSSYAGVQPALTSLMGRYMPVCCNSKTTGRTRYLCECETGIRISDRIRISLVETVVNVFLLNHLKEPNQQDATGLVEYAREQILERGPLCNLQGSLSLVKMSNIDVGTRFSKTSPGSPNSRLILDAAERSQERERESVPFILSLSIGSISSWAVRRGKGSTFERYSSTDSDSD